MTSEIFYLMEIKNGEDLGVWVIHPWRDGLMIHVRMGENCRGRKAVDSAKSAFKWLFENTEFKIIYAAIPSKTRTAQFVASWSGMKYILTEDNHRLYRIDADA